MDGQKTINKKQTDKKYWEEAQKWVSSHKKLIHQAASPYFRHMAADSEDLQQEAVVAAYFALCEIKRKNKPDQFMQFFRVIFKTNCIKLSSGIQTVNTLEDHHLPFSTTQLDDYWDLTEPGDPRIDDALSKLSERQREICRWLLSQPLPATAPDIAKRFNISCRHAFRIISHTIDKIQNEGKNYDC